MSRQPRTDSDALAAPQPWRSLVALIAFSAAVLWSTEAHMGQLHYEPLTLAQVVSLSDVIVIAQKAPPFEQVVAVPIAGGSPKCQPYKKRVYSFRVLEVMSDNGAADVTGKVVHVEEAHASTKAQVYQSYCVEGVEKSPVYSTYDTESDFKEERLILFLLATQSGDFAFVAEGAMESIGRTKEVRASIAAIANQPQRAVPSRTPTSKPRVVP